MPLPKPRAGETRDTFIPRCMRDPATQDITGDTEGQAQDRRLAACFRSWRDQNKGAPMETKLLLLEVKDADKGHVEAVISTFNVVDRDGDVTLPGAIPEGSKVVLSDYNHSAAHPMLGGKPVGKGTVHVTGEKAILVGNYFMSTAAGREAFETLKAMGPEQEWSYGYDTLRHQVPSDEWKAKGARRILEKLAVYEVSPVLVGAGVGTETLNVKSATAAQVRKAIEQEAIRFERSRTELVVRGLGRGGQ